MTAKQSKNFLLLFTAAVIWGVAFVAQSVGMDYVGPYTFNMVRTCWAAWSSSPASSFWAEKMSGRTMTAAGPHRPLTAPVIYS